MEHINTAPGNDGDGGEIQDLNGVPPQKRPVRKRGEKKVGQRRGTIVCTRGHQFYFNQEEDLRQRDLMHQLDSNPERRPAHHNTRESRNTAKSDKHAVALVTRLDEGF